MHKDKNDDVANDAQDHDSLPTPCCCKGACSASKMLLGVGVLALIAGIVWLALTCPSCH